VALERTLGVPIFQEQVMQIAMVAAGFSAGEADGLRRAMAAWKRKGGLEKYHDRLVGGMVARGYEQDFAEGVFKQIQGFSDYGFPESHAASFALLVYASAWLKCHYPAEFLVGLLNSQPMGFYSPAQLVQDARRHQVTVWPVDVQHSGVDSALDGPAPAPLKRAGRHRRCAWACAWWPGCRRPRPSASPRPAPPGPSWMPRTWPAAPAWSRPICATWRRPMRCARWPATAASRCGRPPACAAPRPCCAARRWTRRRWPCRPPRRRGDRGRLPEHRPDPAPPPAAAAAPAAAAPPPAHRRGPAGLPARPAGAPCRHRHHAPAPAHRQRHLFITLEDETGMVQAICWPRVYERFRTVLVSARLLGLAGTWQREGEVCNLIVGHAEDLTPGWAGWPHRPQPGFPLRTSGRGAGGLSKELSLSGFAEEVKVSNFRQKADRRSIGVSSPPVATTREETPCSRT
jgi:error-prone DNA polymerase